MRLKFEYGTATVRELRAVTGPVARNQIPEVISVELNGEPLQPTPRFWRSFFGRFHLSESIFRYFSHAEVFRRISARAESERFGFCIERRSRVDGKLLAVSNPQRSVIDYKEVAGLVRRYDGMEMSYQDGVVSSTHTPRSGEQVNLIGGDRFQNRYIMQTPIDGYGLPRIHLSLIRLECLNGMVGYSRAFRSDISVGKDVGYSIARVLDNYDNDSGYAALRERFQSAQKSWASLRETQELYELLISLEGKRGLTQKSIVADYYEMTGRPHELYGLANLSAFSEKRQRLLPARCRVYDLINFASEVATHKAQGHASWLLQAYIGKLVSDEYDMEGTAEKVPDFQDFFVSAPDTKLAS